MSSVNFQLIDHSAENSSVRVYLPQITAANHDAITGDSGAGQSVYELRLAINDVTLCNHVNRTISHSVIPDAGTVPANAFAQRELKLRVQYQDDVTSKRYSLTIPGADLAALAQASTDVVDMTGTEAAALKAALETYGTSVDGNALTVLGMAIVGRNS